jgi:HSP20 family molecular chaperone IbpA
MTNLALRNRNSLSPFFGQFDDFLRDFFEDDRFDIPSPRQRSLIRREDDRLFAELDVPGVKKSDISVYLQDGRLNISWKKRGQSLSHTEYVGDVVEPEASVEDGVLTVRMRIPQAQRMEVEVK